MSTDTDTPAAPVVAYLRVSTEEQGDSRAGLDAQRAAVAAEAARRGWTVEEHEETASGARLGGRPVLAGLLDRLDAEGGVLVVSRLDRLSRSVVDAASLMDRARRRGWALVALDLGVDTSTPSGALMSHVVAATAQYERDLIAARTRDALAARKASGARLGRRVAMDKATRARIAAEREEGRSLRAIADGLTADGVPTARGGERWYASTVRAALRSLDLDREAAEAATTAGRR